jgi:hypothetical protein
VKKTFWQVTGWQRIMLTPFDNIAGKASLIFFGVG